jgi:hypothetical protein
VRRNLLKDARRYGSIAISRQSPTCGITTFFLRRMATPTACMYSIGMRTVSKSASNEGARVPSGSPIESLRNASTWQSSASRRSRFRRNRKFQRRWCAQRRILGRSGPVCLAHLRASALKRDGRLQLPRGFATLVCSLLRCSRVQHGRRLAVVPWTPGRKTWPGQRPQ